MTALTALVLTGAGDYTSVYKLRPMSSMQSPEILPILKRLNAAVGYLNLGMPQDAWNELEEIEAKDRARPKCSRCAWRSAVR